MPAPLILHVERLHAVVAHVREVHRLDRMVEAGFCRQIDLIRFPVAFFTFIFYRRH